MKKFISFAIICIVLLACLVLVSCDFLSNIIPSQTTIKPPVEEIRTKVTEEEWKANLLKNNFTYTYSDSHNSYTLMMTDNFVKMKNSQMDVLIDIENRVLFHETSFGWFAETGDVNPDAYTLTLEDVLGDIQFWRLVYYPDSKIYKYESYGIDSKFVFENGNLVYASLINTISTSKTLTVTNIGTTVLKQPQEYTDISDGKPSVSTADESVRTTATELEWLNNMMLDNYTINTFMAASGTIFTGKLKLTGSEYQLTQKYGRNYSNTYYVLRDDIVYLLDKRDDGWRGVQKNNVRLPLLGDNIFEEFIYVPFSSLIYNEEGRYYEFEGRYLYFEDGNLVKVVLTENLGDEALKEAVLLISDMGNTTVAMPSFEIYVEKLEFELNETGTGYIVTGNGTYLNKEVIIPDTYMGLPVVGIAERAFYNCRSYKSIYIPNSVTSIGPYAFYGCESLESIRLPDTLTEIDSYVFANCYALTEINIPQTVTSIGDYAFYICTSLTDVEIPESVINICDYAFACCNLLTSIEIPDSVISIGNCAFDCCYYLSDLIIPNSVTSIGDGAFQHCSSLTSIVIPDSVTIINTNVFAGCESLKSVVIPETVTIIGQKAFAECTSLQEIIIPNSVTSLGEGAFNNCRGLRNIVIPDSVTSIGDWAFNYCYLLTSIVIPNSVTVINNSVFSDCWSLQNVVIAETVTIIGNHAFAGCKLLEEITIPDSVTTLGAGTFYNCTALKNIVIPNSVTSIGNGTFSGCSSLIGITFDGTVEQWNTMVEGELFNEKTNAECTIYCIDGKIAKDGTVTYY